MISILIAAFFFCLAVGWLLALWISRNDDFRSQRQAKAHVGCLGFIFGLAIFVCLGIVAVIVMAFVE